MQTIMMGSSLRNHIGTAAVFVLPALVLIAVWAAPAGSLGPAGENGHARTPRAATNEETLREPAGNPSIAESLPSAAFDDDRYWDKGFVDDDVSGPIRAVAIKDGDVYIVGQFATAGGISAHNIAKWDGQNWSALGGGVTNDDEYHPAVVDDILVIGDDIYICGRFSHAGGRLVNNVARWDGSRWNALGTGLDFEDPLYTPRAYALAVHNGVVYAGGYFDLADGVPAKNVAAWNGLSWSALKSGLGDTVYDVMIWKEKVYCGTHLASVYEWNGSAWRNIGMKRGSGHTILALAANDSLLFAGGYFPTVDGTGLSSFACWNGTTWQPLGVYSGVEGTVFEVGIWENDLFIGGDFTVAGGLSANNVRRWDGTRWYRMGDGVYNGTNNPVLGMAPSGVGMYIAGSFTAAGGEKAGGLALWNGDDWMPVYQQGSNNSINNSVTALAASPGGVYCGGDFTRAGDAAAAGVAQWDGTAWMRMGSGISTANRPSSGVHAIVEWNDTVYAGGNFTHAGGQRAASLAMWDGSGWTEWGGGAWMREPYGTLYIEGEVYAIVQKSGIFYVGGHFHRLGGTEMIHIGKWNGSGWESLAGGILAPLGGGVNALAFGGDTLYAAGRFNAAGGMPALNIAGWNDSVWFSLGGGIEGIVYALASDGKHLYAGGDFLGAGGIETKNIAEWDGSAWHTLGDGLDGIVLDLAVIGGNLCATGLFTMAGFTPVNHIALWDGAEWKPMGSGLDGPGRTLAARGYELFVGGDFFSAGSKPSFYFARWCLPGTLVIRRFSAESSLEGVSLEWDIFSNVEMAGIAVCRKETGTQTEITVTGDQLLDPSVRHYFDRGARSGKTYEYVLSLVRADGSEVKSDPVEAAVPVPPLALRRNYPNPFREVTSIEFSLSRTSRVVLSIYNVRGELIKRVQDKIYEPGAWLEKWDGTDRQGTPAGSGIYFYRLEAEGQSLTRKMVLLRSSP